MTWPPASSAAAKAKEAEARASATKSTKTNGKSSDAAAKQTADEPESMGLAKRLLLDALLYFVKGLIATYDLISQPYYYYKQQVARRRREVDKLRSVKLEPHEPSSPWRQVDLLPQYFDLERHVDSFNTYDSLMRSSYKNNDTLPCYGYRQVLEERMSKRPDNPDKLIRQVRLTDFKWCTYGQFERQIEAARRGLLREGVRAGQRVVLYADTRPEWQICSQALIRLGAVVATMYSTLGVDGIVHTLNETEASLVITQRDKVDRLLKLAPKLATVRKIIYMETNLYLPLELGGAGPEDERKFLELCKPSARNPSWSLGRQNSREPLREMSSAPGQQNGLEAPHENQRPPQDQPAKQDQEQQQQVGEQQHQQHQQKPIRCSSLCELIKSGLELAERAEELAELERYNNGDGKLERRTRDSLAVIMYTSGSTGIPKGVLISHGNIMATLKAFSYVTKDFVHAPRENVCVAYLPLAHIFEFCIESVMLYHGVRFGFASPHTLTDKSPGLMAGEAGDLGRLQPTVMIIVPLILDRIMQGVTQALRAQSYFKQQLVSYLIDYKSYWQQRQYETPLVDKLICSKMSVALGGRARFVICGSAPLSAQTQSFVRAALNLKLPQGFGTTETCAATSCQLFDDQSTQNVGLPVVGSLIKLEPWHEGNYTPDDKPNPRGEIVVGGPMIAQGYFKLEQQTREAFYVDAQGTRWYRTGDIGEVLPNGQLKIVDRKKDLVKLQNGEYISLGRVESTLKSNPYTDNFCVYANSNYNYVIALGPANEMGVRALAQQIVDEYDRLAGSQKSLANGSDSSHRVANGQTPANTALISTTETAPKKAPNSSKLHEAAHEDERESLLADGVRRAALAELTEVLASYREDRLNNNDVAAAAAAANGAPGSRPRANSADSTGAGDERLAKLCRNELILERVLGHVSKMAAERNLLTLEVPKKLLLLAEEWTEDKNLVTAAMKIRRNFIYKRYERQLGQLYAAEGAAAKA